MTTTTGPLNRGGVALGLVSVAVLDVIVGVLLVLSLAVAVSNGGYFGEPAEEPSDLDGLIWVGFLAASGAPWWSRS